MSSTQQIRFGGDTWAKGTRGVVAAHATDKPRIENMRVWTDGLLGPRPLFTAAEVLVDSSSGSIYQNNVLIWPAQWHYTVVDVDPVDVWCVARTGELRVYKQLDGSLWDTITIASMTIDDQNPPLYQINERLWLFDGNILRLEGLTTDTSLYPTHTDVSAAIATAFGHFAFNCKGSTVHQGRAFYWGDALLDAAGTLGPRSRVYYSDTVVTGGDAAYGTFTSASQYFDVDGRVKGCVSVGAVLYVWTEGGRWSLMQGSGNPENATFSDLGYGKIPQEDTWPAAHDQYALFLSSDNMSVVTLNAGGDIDDFELGYLGFDTDATPYGNKDAPMPATSSNIDSIMVPSPYGTLNRQQYNNVWTDETWGVPDTSGRFQVRVDEINGKEMLATQNTLVTPIEWSIYERPVANNEPSRTAGGTWTEYIEDYDDSPGTVVLPRIFNPTKQVRVKRVVIDGVTWESAGTDYPAAALTVKVDDGKSSTATLTLGPGATPLGSVADSPKKPIRLVATGAPTAYTHFSDITIDGIKGFAIESVTVEFEISEGLVQ